MTTPREAAETLERVRAQAPLIHNITNYVVMNTTANALYAVGASPAMIHSPDEVEDFLALSQGLVINIGTISSPWLAGMKLAAHSARQRGVPWVLDPVGMGATRYRNQAARDLALLGPTAIRGNASEIMALAQWATDTAKGVDSTQEAEAAVEAARALARETGAIVAVTGASDFVTDGHSIITVTGGDRRMAKITGMGCTATALITAALAASHAPQAATAHALSWMAAAGAAAGAHAAGPGSLQVALLDTLYALGHPTLQDHATLSGPSTPDGAPDGAAAR